MRLFVLCIALAACVLLAGCARARVTTSIRADGSWVRTVVLTGQEKKDMQVTPTLDDTFVIPSGPGWTSKEEKQSDDRVLTLERAVAAGASLQGDLSIKRGDGAKLKLVNEAKVTRVGPNRFEYRETLRFKGDADKVLGEIKIEDLGKIKAYLPKPLATDANAHALAEKMTLLAIPMIFGPGDPLLAIGMLHPDLAARRAGQRMGAVLIKALEEQFGEQLPLAQRREVARQLIQETFSSKMSTPDHPPASPNGNSSGLTPLMFIVKTPGRVVSSNGEIDELSGEVFWALFDEAAAFNDIVLTAVVEVP
jgi:hypothetical protein